MRSVAVVVLEHFVPFDVAVPREVFSRVRLPTGAPGYSVVVCGPTPTPRRLRSGMFDLTPTHGVGAIESADLVFTTGQQPFEHVPARVIDAVRHAAAGGAVIASICGGAFVLAATGLLDGLRATTHWSATTDLQRMHPSIAVDPDVLYVDNGQILSSAGAAASMDLCIHLVRRDYGSTAASHAARAAVMPLERAGGQAQFIEHETVAAVSDLAPVLDWIAVNLSRDLPVQEIAVRAAMSERTLHRRFRAELGSSPSQWVQRARVLRAQQLLETTDRTVETIASEVGYQSASTLRAHFQAHLHTNPTAYRRALAHRHDDGVGRHRVSGSGPDSS